jgi:hypothetical protein
MPKVQAGKNGDYAASLSQKLIGVIPEDEAKSWIMPSIEI